LPLDGIMLGFTARELHELLSGGRIERITQPESDLLILNVHSNGKTHKLLISANPNSARMHITGQNYKSPFEAPMFCMLMRKHLTGGHITYIKQINGDRLVEIAVDCTDELGESCRKTLYLEAMGRHSNLTLEAGGKIIDAIRHVTGDMSRVRQALPGLPFIFPPAQDKIPPEDATEEAVLARFSRESGPLGSVLPSIISGLSSITSREFAFRLAGSGNADIKALDLVRLSGMVCALLKKLPELEPPLLLLNDNGAVCDAVPFPYITYTLCPHTEMPSVSAALDALFAERDKKEHMTQRSQSLLRFLKAGIERLGKKLALLEEERAQSEKSEDLRIMGELLTAQLHLVSRGSAEVILDNYYNGGQVTVPLDIRLNPAQNAQRYFKRYQKACAAQKMAAEQKEKALAELRVLEDALCDIGNCETEEDLGDIRNSLIENGLLKKAAVKKTVRKTVESMPLRFVSTDGIEIAVGKNSIQNERLTKAAQGSDLWVHAKDMPGSHVIVRAEDKPVPDSTLIQAAQLAAYYSKAGGNNVPVDYTLRKNVKKPGGTPPGYVTYTGQHTLMIQVTEKEIRALNRIGRV
jgi:predicted ribosome quality control (RQC) complex YloA/Tae2 family protein